MSKNNSAIRKFIDSINIDEYDVLTDTGWEDIKSINKTIKYRAFRVETKSFYLEGADDHIIFDKDYNEIYLKELSIGDSVLTENGIEIVLNIKDLEYSDNMYDLEINSENHRYYTNGILSHNSTILSNFAANSIRNGKNAAVITLELSDRKYMRRVGANLLNITTGEYKDFDETRKDLIKHKLDNFYGMLGWPAGNLWIKEFPTGTASFIDIENSLLRREDKTGIKYDLVIVDYLNLMKSDGNSNQNMYERIKRISEGLRAISQRNEWCVVSATQVRKEYFDKDVLGMDAAAESSGLIATVDSLFAASRDSLSDIARIELIANRDEGYTGSSCNFKMQFKNAKMIETNEFQYYGDEDGTNLEKEMLESYKKNEIISAIAGQSIGTNIEIPEVNKNNKETDYESILNSI